VQVSLFQSDPAHADVVKRAASEGFKLANDMPDINILVLPEVDRRSAENNGRAVDTLATTGSGYE
jgi:hypothetical protein